MLLQAGAMIACGKEEAKAAKCSKLSSVWARSYQYVNRCRRRGAAYVNTISPGLHHWSMAGNRQQIHRNFSHPTGFASNESATKAEIGEVLFLGERFIRKKVEWRFR